jgi:type IV pilus assembly protein PilB
VQSKWQSVRDRFGEILVEEGLLTQIQLEKTLEQQKRSGLKLNQFLVRKGVLKENQLVDLLSRQLKIDKYDPEKFPLESNLSTYVPSDFAKKFNIVPLQRRGSVLKLAMIDPMDISAVDVIENATNLEVDPIICTEQEICDLTYNMYGISAELYEGISQKSELSIETEEAEQPDKDITVFSLQGLAEDPPIIKMVNSILARASREGASDIHISPEKRYVQMRFRVDGKLRHVPAPPKSFFLPTVSRIKILAGLDIAITRTPQDGRFTFRIDEREINVRVSTLPTIHGENVVLRLLDVSGKQQTIDDIGLLPSEREKVDRAIVKPWGMILSTGPTGSGKSTTLYAIIRQINHSDINIITLEDPVEYRMEKIRQVQLNRKANMDFANGLRAILRQDPDVVMVGEIRDAETANIAVQAALTGHRMLSTLHTNDAAGAITRLNEMGIEPFLIASTLLAAMAQRLVRKVCKHCAEPYQPSKAAIRSMGLKPDGPYTFLKGKGCQKCHETGFSGRTGVFEILELDEFVQDMVLERASSTQITTAAVKSGRLITLKANAAIKAAQGLTTLEEAGSAIIA